MSSSNAPCAACKYLRRKCTQECVFAPYFPPDTPEKFINVHKIFGASNVGKILHDISPNRRNEAVESLAYEALCRIQDPIFGCVRHVANLQQSLRHVQMQIEQARKELAVYIGPAAMQPMVMNSNINNPGLSFDPQTGQMVGVPPQQLVSMAAKDQEMLRVYAQQQQQQQQELLYRQQQFAQQQMYMLQHQQQQQVQHQQQQVQQENDLVRLNEGFEDAGDPAGAVGYIQMPANMQHGLALGGSSYENDQHYHHQLHHHQQANGQAEIMRSEKHAQYLQMMAQQEASQSLQQAPRDRSEDDKSFGPL